jgi:hypothetical protein
MIYLGVHNYHVANGKCKESLEETRRLITKEVVCTPYAKMFVISLNASKTHLVGHLLDDYNNGKVKLFKGQQLEQIHDKFCELNPPNIRNLVAYLKHHLGGGYIDNILELKFKSRYD